MSRLIPRGAVVAGLGKRFLAAVIDMLPFLVIGGLSTLAGRLSSEPTVVLVTGTAAAVLSLAYALYQWWAYAVRGAGIGAQAMGLRLVSLKDGEPIGWWCVFLRNLVFSALMASGVGGVALLVFLVIHERRQGWHDMAAGSIVVQPKAAEARTAPRAQRKVAQASTVGLPPHLSSTFSPQPGTTSTQNWDAFGPQGGHHPSPHGAPAAQPARHPGMQPSAPDWLPGVQSEPVQPAQHQQAPYQATGQW
ncbi:RDD family protein, partial [Tessaracoccus lubricantis]